MHQMQVLLHDQVSSREVVELHVIIIVTCIC